MKREFLSGGMQSAGMCRAMSALEAFYDNEPAFRQYLDGQGADSAARAQGLRLRPSNQIHSKVKPVNSSYCIIF
jgi:hypothetical protein